MLIHIECVPSCEPRHPPPRKLRLAVQGYAFAQSVKLAVFETIVDASIEKVGKHENMVWSTCFVVCFQIDA